MIKVENKNRQLNATEFYYYIKDADGVDYLFTPNHVSQAIERAKKNPEDIPEAPKDENKFVHGMILGVIMGALFIGGFWLAKYTLG
jgi:hypothetical protein